MKLTEIIPVLQIAIGPVILISGIGLLLLTMTNRFARTIDRARQLAREVNHPDANRAHVVEQIGTIYRRARVLRATITMAGVSVLLAAFLIIALFLSALFQADYALPIGLIFIACLASLIGSLIGFIYDVHISLVALRLELSPVKADLK